MNILDYYPFIPESDAPEPIKVGIDADGKIITENMPIVTGNTTLARPSTEAINAGAKATAGIGDAVKQSPQVSVGDAANVAVAGYQIIDDLFSSSDIKYQKGVRPIDPGPAGKNVAASAAKGMAAGSALGPAGAAVGAVLGGVSSLISGKKDKRAFEKAEKLYFQDKFEDIQRQREESFARLDKHKRSQAESRVREKQMGFSKKF